MIVAANTFPVGVHGHGDQARPDRVSDGCEVPTQKGPENRADVGSVAIFAEADQIIDGKIEIEDRERMVDR